MSGINLNTTATNIPPSISDFKRAAQEGVMVEIFIDGSTFDVRARGHLNTHGGSDHSVDWVTPQQQDTTHFFLQALRKSYGDKLSSITSRELGIESTRGKPLASRIVINALNMAETSSTALCGVDYFTRLEHSAEFGGSAYRKALIELKIESSLIREDQKKSIDKLMLEKFDQEASAGRSPVASNVVKNWLFDELTNIVKDN
jgi:hypothetical protein